MCGLMPHHFWHAHHGIVLQVAAQQLQLPDGLAKAHSSLLDVTACSCSRFSAAPAALSVSTPSLSLGSSCRKKQTFSHQAMGLDSKRSNILPGPYVASGAECQGSHCGGHFGSAEGAATHTLQNVARGPCMPLAGPNSCHLHWCFSGKASAWLQTRLNS